MTIFKSRIGLASLTLLIVLFNSLGALAQSRTITGTVVDSEDGSSLPGATIMIEGSTVGTVTDIDGRFSLEASSENVLVISFIGYASTTTKVGTQSDFQIKLDVSIEALDEIVVVGYGTQQKKVSTGSISKITAQNLDGYKVASVSGALDGQVSGVIVSQSSGQPGAGKSILIRGISTNGDNSPLYVIDGMSVTGIDNINPDDIESIDVLKDAASCAIYGSRAANGVVIITTKKGSKGNSKISYEAFTSVSNPWKLPEMLDSEEYIELTREKFANANQTASIDALGFPNAGGAANNTDWMDVIFDQATVTNHRLTAQFEGAYLSMEYWDQNGVVGGDKSNYKRYAIRFNSAKDINDYVSISQNMYINRTENQNIGTNNAFGTVIADAFAYDPLTAVYDETAQYGFAQSQWVQKEYVNPLSRLFLSGNDGHADQIVGNVHLKVEPIEGISFHSDLGMDYTWSNFRSFTPDYAYTPAFFNVNNGVSMGYNFGQSLQFENFLSFDKRFGDHNVNVIAGTTYLARENTYAGGSTLNIPDAVKFNDQFQYIDAGQDTSDLAYGGAGVDYRMISYFGRLQYDFAGKYLFSATIRRDGSSKFGLNNRFGVFPSFSAGWVISDEGFFTSSVVSFVKLRGSWGVNGSDRIGDLAYASRIVSAFTYPLGQDQVLVRGSSFNTLPNPNLKWEESVQFDLGLELKFLDDKLSAEVDYYVKTTKDLLGSERVPGLTGVLDLPLSNLGEIQNKGIEASVSYRHSIGKLNFRTSVNYTHFKNTVVAVPGTTEFITGWNWPVRNVAITRMTENQPVGHFVGLKTDGIFQNQAEVFAHISSQGETLQPNAKPGDLRFVDVNDDGVINNDDLTNIGSPWPKHIVGLNFSADYMGVDFSMVLSTQMGQDLYRTYERSDIPYTNYQSFWSDRWTEANPSNDLPRLVANDPNGNQRPSDFYVEDGSFLRLRNLQVGYSIPVNILEKVKLSAVRIYFSANNLFTVTNYRGFDPEIGTSGWILDTGIDKGYYPSNKTFGGGIKITM